MARVWLFVQGGWEYGPLRRNQNATTAQARPFIEGADGDTAGSGANPPEVAVVASGKFAHRPSGAGLQGTSGRGAHVFTLAKDRIVWCGNIAITGFASSVTVAQDYALTRCAKLITSGGGGTKYLGIGLTVATLGPPVTYQFVILRFLSDGSFDVKLGSNSASFAVSSTMRWVFIDHDSSAGTARLVVNGTVGGSVSTGTVQATAHHNRDNRFVGGKGTPTDAEPVYDDFCTCEIDADSDRPPSTLRQILYQPTCDVNGERDWTGDHRNVDDENDDAVAPGNTDANVITPSAAGEQQIFAFHDLTDEPSQTATVEAVLLVWEQKTAGAGAGPNVFDSHKPFARTSGVALTDLSGDYGSGAHAVANRAWFGRLMQTTPEGAAWTPALFNQLQAGLEAKGAGNEPCGEFYAVPLGEYIAQPTATPTSPSLCTEDAGGGAAAASLVAINRARRYALIGR